MSIYRAPKILVVSIKRFYFKDMMHRQKISTHVNFKTDGEGLDLTPYLTSKLYEHDLSLCGDLGGAESPLHGLGGMEPSLAGKATYDLLSLSNHAGAGMNGEATTSPIWT